MRQRLGSAFVDGMEANAGATCDREPREDDDKAWWRDLVDRVLEQVAPSMKDLDRDNFSSSPTIISPSPAFGNYIPR